MRRPPRRLSRRSRRSAARRSRTGRTSPTSRAPSGWCKHAIDALGGLDILVNNAGIIRDRMLVNMDEAEWDAVIDVHLKGHFAPTRHAAAYWRERSKAGDTVRARVINTSSPSGVFGNVGQANYGSAKAGIAAMTLIAAQELGRYGVTVNCIAPNARTRMTEQAFGEIAAPEDGFDAMDPGNMAPVVVALCADEAQDITGQVLFVYGGSVNFLQGWSPGELFARDGKWDADELLAELRGRYPNGAQPAEHDGRDDECRRPVAERARNDRDHPRGAGRKRRARLRRQQVGDGRPEAHRPLRRCHRRPPVDPRRPRGRQGRPVRRHDRARLPVAVAPARAALGRDRGVRPEDGRELRDRPRAIHRRRCPRAPTCARTPS